VCDFVWDSACGNGQAAIGFLKYFNRILATDISENQISNAIRHSRIIYSVQSAEKPAIKENQFDLVCAAQALHWFDLDLFWSAVKRLLKPGGIFAAWGYSWFSIDKQIDAVIERKFLEFLEPYWQPQNQLLWNHYRDVPFPFAIIQPPKLEMKMTWNLEQLFEYLRSWSAVQRCLQEHGEHFFLDAYRAAGDVWGDLQDKKDVEMELCLVVGRHEI
jgi:SAM-dependent methyltransferase